MIRAALLLVAATGLAGCFGGKPPTCDKPREYQQSRSIAPLSVPEGLDTPDRNTTFTIPPATTPDDAVPPGTCLDQPPDYFGR